MRYPRFLFVLVILSAVSYQFVFAAGQCAPGTLNYSSANTAAAGCSPEVGGPFGFTPRTVGQDVAGNLGSQSIPGDYQITCGAANPATATLYACSCDATTLPTGGTQCPGTTPGIGDTLKTTPTWTNAGVGASSCGTTKCSYYTSCVTSWLAVPAANIAAAGVTCASVANDVTTMANGWALTPTAAQPTKTQGSLSATYDSCNDTIIKVDRSTCTAPITCGTSHGGAFAAKPTTNLCSDSSAPAVSGSGPWTWSCGSNACSAYINCTQPDGTTNKWFGGPGCPSWKDYCTGGPASDPANPYQRWSEAYYTAGTYIGWVKLSPPADASPLFCSQATCGTSNGGSFASAPSTNLCANGSASAVSGSGPWTWTCTNGGPSNSASCTASKAATPVDCVASWIQNAVLTCSVTGACGQSGNYKRTFTMTTAPANGGLSCAAVYPTTAIGATDFLGAACSTTTCVPSNPTLSLSATNISYGSSATITWTKSASGNPTSCTAGGDWSNSGVMTGSGSTGALTAKTSYTYTYYCTNAGGDSGTVTKTLSVCPASTPLWDAASGSCTVVTYSCTGLPSGAQANNISPLTAGGVYAYNTIAGNCKYICDGTHTWNAGTGVCDLAVTTCPIPTSETQHVACDPNASGDAATSGDVIQIRTKAAFPGCAWGIWGWLSDNCAYPSGAWSAWSSCSTSCGTGTRTRSCTTGVGTCSSDSYGQAVSTSCTNGTCGSWTAAACDTSCGLSYTTPYSCTGGTSGTCSTAQPADKSCARTGCTCPSPWGGPSILSGSSVTAYLTSSVNAPVNGTASCSSESRLCTNGSLAGSNTKQTCVVKKASITVPASCVVTAGNSTCSVNATWTSQNLSTPRFYDKNINSTLSNTANSAVPLSVLVAYGGTTFAITDSTAYEYARQTVSAACSYPGVPNNTTFMSSGTGKCEYDVLSSLTASPRYISYDYGATLTWTSNHANSCVAGGPWSNLTPPSGDKFNGTGTTGNLVSNQTYTFACTGLGIPASVKSQTVNVCPSGAPISKNNFSPSCIPDSRVALSLTKGQYTSNGEFTVTPTNSPDSCALKYYEVTRNITTGAYSKNIPLSIKTLPKVIATSGNTVAPVSTPGDYFAECVIHSADGHDFISKSKEILYQTVPPYPVVSLKQTPATISKGNATAISWVVMYPGPVQSTPRTCVLTATPVCTNGSSTKCTTAQTAAGQLLNTEILNNFTDTNDPAGVRKISPTALNTIYPSYTADDGITDWKATGKKTFLLSNSMDFELNCQGTGPYEKAKVRVNVTSSNEG